MRPFVRTCTLLIFWRRDSDGPPLHHPAADRRLKAARVAVSDKSTEFNIPIENLLTPELLRRLAWAPPAAMDAASIGLALSVMGARAWQIDALAEPIAGACLASLDEGVAEPSEAVVDEHQTTATPTSGES